MRIDAETICLIVKPLAVVHFGVHMYELAYTLGLSNFPSAFVSCSIGPHLDSFTITLTLEPFSCVFGSTLINVLLSLCSYSGFKVALMGYTLNSFLKREIFVSAISLRILFLAQKCHMLSSAVTPIE